MSNVFHLHRGFISHPDLSAAEERAFEVKAIDADGNPITFSVMARNGDHAHDRAWARLADNLGLDALSPRMVDVKESRTVRNGAAVIAGFRDTDIDADLLPLERRPRAISQAIQPEAAHAYAEVGGEAGDLTWIDELRHVAIVCALIVLLALLCGIAIGLAERVRALFSYLF